MSSKTLSNPFIGNKGFWLYSRLLIISLILSPFTQSNTLRMPMIGLIALAALGTFVCTSSKKYGSKWLWIGLCVVSVVSVFNSSDVVNLVLLPVFAMVMLAGLQMSTNAGSKFFSFFIVFESIGVAVMLLLQPHTGNGGFIDPINYNIATGILLIAFMLSYKKWMWMILPVLVLGLYLASSEMAIIIFAILGVVILARKDWSVKTLPTIAIIALCIILYTIPHVPEYIYRVSSNQLAMLQGHPLPYQTDLVADPTRGRFEGWMLGLKNITWFGHSFNPLWTTADTIHNLFLRTIYDVGVIGLLGLLTTLVVWSRKTGIYIITIILALSLFDHFLWTQLNVWFWAFLGMSYGTKEFYVFKPS